MSSITTATWPRRRFHRRVFCLAGSYNVLWGLYAVYDPQWLFRFAVMPPLNHPPIFAALGMVVGLYGVLYFEVARVPERGWLIAAVGLTGKFLGPIGLLPLIWTGQWPWRSAVLCLTNDVIWWLPFALYLYHAWPHFWQKFKPPETLEKLALCSLPRQRNRPSERRVRVDRHGGRCRIHARQPQFLASVPALAETLQRFA